MLQLNQGLSRLEDFLQIMQVEINKTTMKNCQMNLILNVD